MLIVCVSLSIIVLKNGNGNWKKEFFEEDWKDEKAQRITWIFGSYTAIAGINTGDGVTDTFYNGSIASGFPQSLQGY